MTGSESLDQLVERVRAQLVERLGASGWTIEATAEGQSRFSIMFHHPLTSDYGFSFDSRKDYLGPLDRFLAHPEFERISRAPVEIPHARLISAIRTNAEGFDWPTTVIERLAVILGGEGVLSEAESEWLGEAGPVWAK